ncbi:MAG: DUF393 domain-containing protein [Alphaproteobacteria bacterium]|nr:DUF393 domain-containing protein [Alphaproteobacteria bacterium]
MDRDLGVTVFFDGACPLCAREIAFYRRRRGGDAIEWFDVSQRDPDAIAPELTRARALGRFHVRTGDGRLVDGGEAFAHLWAALPGFRWLGRVGQRQPFRWCLDRLYDGFLLVRPRLQRLVADRATRCERLC